MIKSIGLVNFTVFDNESIDLHKVTELYGKNGRGKTSLADAISFAFSGCDSHGHPAPTHLIRRGQDKLSVTVTTDKAIIERTLTQKKNGSIKLTRPGQPALSLTQEQLSTMLGTDKDTFLSAFMAGYFMKLNEDRRSAVLRSFIPPVDKYAVLETLMGFPLTEDMRIVLALDKKRTDTVASGVAKMRVQVEKEKAGLDGQKSVLAATPEPGEQPSTVAEELDTILSKKTVWENFESRLTLWKRANAAFVGYDAELQAWNEEMARLQAEMSAIAAPKEPTFPDRSADEKALRAQLKQPPERPAFLNEVDFERCPTCAQVVGTKHKESIANHNKALSDKYNVERATVLAENHEISKKLEWIAAQNARDLDAAKLARAQVREATAQVEKIHGHIRNHQRAQPVPVADPGPQPQPPVFDKVDTDSIEKAKKAYKDATVAIAEWNSRSAAYNSAQKRLAVLDESIAAQDDRINTLRAIEEGLANLDEAIFRSNEHLFAFRRDGFRFALPDNGAVTVTTPWGDYSVLSAGQTILTDALVCEKIAGALPKPVKFIFVDNADLVSGPPIKLDVEQLILAFVTDDEYLCALCGE